MEMTGEELIALPQQATWDALNDTAVLMDCIPGCDSMEKQSDTEYLLTMTAKVGPVSAKFKGKMTLLDVMIAVGGLTDFADGNAATVLRTSDGNKQYSVRLNDLIKRGDVSANVEMRPGDILIIPQSFF